MKFATKLRFSFSQLHGLLPCWPRSGSAFTTMTMS